MVNFLIITKLWTLKNEWQIAKKIKIGTKFSKEVIHFQSFKFRRGNSIAQTNTSSHADNQNLVYSLCKIKTKQKSVLDAQCLVLIQYVRSEGHL